MSGRQLLRLLGKNGWTVHRINGSHHIMTHPDFSYSISVPVHTGEIATGTLHKLLKQAKLK